MEQPRGQPAAAVAAQPPTSLASAVSLPPPIVGPKRPAPISSPPQCAATFRTRPSAVGPATCAPPGPSAAPSPAVIATSTAAARSIPEMGVVAAGVPQPPSGRRLLPRLAPRPAALPAQTGDGRTSSCDSGVAGGRSAAGTVTPSVAPIGRRPTHEAVPTQRRACVAPPTIAPASISAAQGVPRVPMRPPLMCSTGAPSLRGTSPPATAAPPVLSPASACSGSIDSSPPSPLSSPALAGAPPAPPSASASGGDGEAGGPARRRRRRGSRVEKDTPPRELRRVLRNRELARVSNEKRRVRLACMQNEMDELRAAVAAAAAERDAALARVADLEAALLRQGGGRPPPLPVSAPMAPAVAVASAPVDREAPARALPLPAPPLSAQPLPTPQTLPVAGMGAGYAFRPPLRPAQWPSASMSVSPARGGAHMLLQAAAVEMA